MSAVQLEVCHLELFGLNRKPCGVNLSIPAITNLSLLIRFTMHPTGGWILLFQSMPEHIERLEVCLLIKSILVLL